jgi:SAM-dependent methyltransferase
VPLPRYRSAELDRCQDCDLIFLGRAPAEDLEITYTTEDYVDAHNHFFAEDRALEHIAEQRIEWLSRRVAPGPLLEVGPGRGHLLAAARAAGFEPLGVEPSPELAARITAEFEVPVECGFLDEVELPRDGFDVICLYHVLEHVEGPGSMLERLAGLLAPGGLLVIEVPNIASAMAERRGERWPAVQPRELHVSHFTPRTLRGLVERSGLEVAEVDTVAPWHYLPPSLRLRPRALMGFGYRTARLRTLRDSHPSGYDNLRLLASAPV